MRIATALKDFKEYMPYFTGAVGMRIEFARDGITKVRSCEPCE
jgi:hypothetical protein